MITDTTPLCGTSWDHALCQDKNPEFAPLRGADTIEKRKSKIIPDPLKYPMTTQVQNILLNFEALPDEDKRKLASEILHRSLTLDSPPLADDQLTATAEDLFLELDREEA
jgi:hypothetical protein